MSGEKRKAIFKLLGSKCNLCGKTCNLTVHHVKKNTYVLKNRSLEDILKNLDKLECLCRGCHNKHHALHDQSLSYLNKVIRLKRYYSELTNSKKVEKIITKQFKEATTSFIRKKKKITSEIEEHFLKEYPMFSALFEIIKRERGEIPGHSLLCHINVTLKTVLAGEQLTSN